MYIILNYSDYNVEFPHLYRIPAFICNQTENLRTAPVAIHYWQCGTGKYLLCFDAFDPSYKITCAIYTRLFAMSKQFVNFPIVALWSLVLLLLSIKPYADSSKPLNTKDFYKQIYSNVCPSGELSCLREVLMGSFQLSLPRNRGEKVGFKSV